MVVMDGGAGVVVCVHRVGDLKSNFLCTGKTGTCIGRLVRCDSRRCRRYMGLWAAWWVHPSAGLYVLQFPAECFAL